MAEKKVNLGNAAFFATKKLAKDIEAIQNELRQIEELKSRMEQLEISCGNKEKIENDKELLRNPN